MYSHETKRCVFIELHYWAARGQAARNGNQRGDCWRTTHRTRCRPQDVLARGMHTRKTEALVHLWRGARANKLPRFLER